MIFLYRVYFLSHSVLGKGFFSILNGQWLGYLLTDVTFGNVTPDSRSILSDRSFADLRQCWFVKINNALVVVVQTKSASFSSLPGGIGIWKCAFWGERKPGVGVCEWRKFHLSTQEQKSPTNSTPMCFPLLDLSRHQIDVRQVLSLTFVLALILLCYFGDACIK